MFFRSSVKSCNQILTEWLILNFRNALDNGYVFWEYLNKTPSGALGDVVLRRDQGFLYFSKKNYGVLL